MKSFAKGLGLSIAAFAVIGCGSGTSSLPSQPSSEKMAKITPENSQKVSSGALGSVSSLDNSTQDLNNLRKVADTKSLRAVSKELIKLSRHESQSCEGGGNIEADSNDGRTGTVTFNNCQQGDVIVDGNAQVLSNSYPIREVKFNNFSMKDSFTGDYMSIESGTVKMNESNNELWLKKLYADIKSGSSEYSYMNFNLHKDYQKTELNGYVKTPCTNGYVKIETKPDLKYIPDEPEGLVEISSNSKTVKIKFNGDSVDYTDVDGNTTTYSLDEFSNKMSSSCSAMN